MLFRARLRWQEKLELLVLFSGGLFVMMAGILRCMLILTVWHSLIENAQNLKQNTDTNACHFHTYQAGKNGAEQAGSWACRETFVAVLIGNLPMIYPLFRRLARRTGLYLTTKTGQTYPTYPLSDGENSGYARRKKFLHPLSLPAETQWNTIDEQMILPASRQQPPTCTAGPGNWDTRSQSSHSGGIKVVHETIVQSAEKPEWRREKKSASSALDFQLMRTRIPFIIQWYMK